MEKKKELLPSERPYRVVTNDGAILAGFDNKEQAEARAKVANNDAEALDLKTRYSVEEYASGAAN